jgi:hypothetical protein
MKTQAEQISVLADMHDNPYQPPTESPQFYTDDIIGMPVTAIWRTSRRQGAIGCLVVFPMFLVRKLLQLRFPANHATCRVTELPALGDNEIPAEICRSFAPLESACREAGMEHVRSFRPPWIGNKSGMFSIWLDASGELYCNITHIDLQLGSIRKSKTVFACHSRLASGIHLNTAPVRPEDWIPELIPPHQDLVRLAPDTPPAAVIRRHKERLIGRADIVHFNSETLLDEVIRGSQEMFDFLLAKGVYTPLSSAETKRLLSANQRPASAAS